MKKIIASFLSLCMVFLLCSCSGNTSRDETVEKETENDKTITIKKEEKNGFDKATNHKYSFFGLNYSIPIYFGEVADSSTDLLKDFFAEKGDAIALLRIGIEQLDSAVLDFSEKQKTSCNRFLNGFSDVTDLITKEMYIAGFPSVNMKFIAVLSDRNVKVQVVYIFSEIDNVAIGICLIETDNTTYTYFSDFDKIINSITLAEEAEKDKDLPNNNEVQSYESPKETDDVDPELKAALDSYEAFIDEYTAFMKSYYSSGNMLSMLDKYSGYMQKMVDFEEKMSQIDQSELSGADLAYYLEVMARVSKKTIDAIV